jgi:hypothetical protein
LPVRPAKRPRRETADGGRWTLTRRLGRRELNRGGNAAKEDLEESSFRVEPRKLAAVWDRTRQGIRPALSPPTKSFAWQNDDIEETEARALTVLDEPLSDDIRHELVGVVDALEAHSWRIKGLSLPEAWSGE